MGINGLLDVARATYLETIQEITREVQRQKEIFPYLVGLKLHFTNSRGYHICIPNVPKLPG